MTVIVTSDNGCVTVYKAVKTITDRVYESITINDGDSDVELPDAVTIEVLP